MLFLLRAPPEGLRLSFPTDRNPVVHVQGSRSIVSSLISQGVIENFLPLHQTDVLKHLQNKWVFAFLDEQPLDEINGYFGTEIAMYFAWLGHMTTALWAPAIFGVIMYFFGGFKFEHHDSKENLESHSLFSDICFVIFALFNCVWSTTYLEFWKRKQAELSFKWGTYELRVDPFLEDPRPAFKGDYLAPNPVSGRLEPYYPWWKHVLIRYGITYPATFICVLFMFFTMFCLLQLQDLADYYFITSFYFKWITYVPMIIYALIILTGEHFYRKLALFFNDLENYRTDDEYENFLISKIVLFQCVSAFGSLFYIAFYLNDMARLQETLATLLITRQLTQNFIEIVMPVAREKLKLAQLTYKMTRSMSDHSLRRHVEDVRRKRDYTTGSFPTYSEFDSDGDDWVHTPDMENEIRQRKKTLSLRAKHASESNLAGLRSPVTPENLPSARLPLPEFRPSDSKLWN
uniref:Anoctamin n=1 Tax=Acrobeloides nanus TaxID=290746 RepID=A0A914CUP9_9BILA